MFKLGWNEFLNGKKQGVWDIIVEMGYKVN